jgi:hypothetical protein
MCFQVCKSKQPEKNKNNRQTTGSIRGCTRFYPPRGNVAQCDEMDLFAVGDLQATKVGIVEQLAAS